MKALFDKSSQAKSLAAVEKDLAELGVMIEQSEELRDALSNPLLSRQAAQSAMKALLSKMGAHADTQQFVALLARNKRLVLLPQIIEMFAEQAALARGEMAASVASPKPLSEKEMAALAQSLSKACGRKVILRQRIDASLLGGLVVRIGSQQFDASLAGKLERLRNNLKVA